MARASAGVFSREIVFGAIKGSFPKLDPRSQIRNPVMFIVELGSAITTVIFFLNLFRGDTGDLWFVAVISIWLWLTVLFANFAEAVAEGRGKAQAKALRATRTTTLARLRDGREVPAPELQRGDVVVVEAGEVIPADGEVIEGVGSVDESAITGESAPVIREAGRRSVGRHRRDEAALGPPRDRGHAGAGPVLPGPDDRARRGCRAAQDPERDRAQHPACRPDDHVRRRRRHAASRSPSMPARPSRRPC